MKGKSLEVLHIASFTGNVGDNANHNGTRHQLSKNTSRNYIYHEEEIRRYYQNYTKPDSLSFDEEFVTRANKHDLVIIGSGNFFELWIESSSTGTTVDLDPEHVDSIEVPVIFYGLGCDPHKGVPGSNREKFQRFLDKVLVSDHCFVSVRNDGSISHIRKLFGEDRTEQIHMIPDGGFFTKVEDRSHPELSDDKINIAVNIAKDMTGLRFPHNTRDEHTYESFLGEMAACLDELLFSKPDYELVFMPHIYSDIDAISEVLKQMNDMNRRSRVKIAPYLNGAGAEKYIFDTYRKADLAMGMRFHTNVCSIGQNTPTIGLVSYPKVGDLYSIELELEDRAVDVKQKGFAERLTALVTDSISDQEAVKARYRNIVDTLEEQVKKGHGKISSFLEQNIQ